MKYQNRLIKKALINEQINKNCNRSVFIKIIHGQSPKSIVELKKMYCIIYDLASKVFRFVSLAYDFIKENLAADIRSFIYN